jgi:putative ABC transport system permease protein
MNELFSKKYGPSIPQLFIESFNSLHLLKMRSMLALIGIIIGSASIIALMNISHNASNESIRSFKSLGTDTIIVNFPISLHNKSLLPFNINTDYLKKENPDISYISPITLSSAHINHYGMKSEATLIGSLVLLGLL